MTHLHPFLVVKYLNVIDSTISKVSLDLYYTSLSDRITEQLFFIVVLVVQKYILDEFLLDVFLI